MNTKNILTIIIGLLMIIISTAGATAVTWTQYTPSPTTNQIDFVQTLSNGHAFAVTNAATNFLLYNGDNWSEISKPSTSILNANYTFIQAIRYHNNDRILIFYNGTGSKAGYYSVIELNTNTKTYTELLEQQGIMSGNVVCLDDYNACFARNVSNKAVWQVYPSYSLETTIITGGWSVVQSNALITISTGYDWNGISWVDRLGGQITGFIASQYINANTRYFCAVGTNAGIYEFNVTSGFINRTNSSFYCGYTIQFGRTYIYGFEYVSQERKIIFGDASAHLKHYDVDTKAIHNESTNEKVFIGVSYDHYSGIGWAVGAGGIIYMYDLGGSTGTPTYTLTSSASPNPANFGNNITFTATPITPNGETSNISVEILNSTGDWVYGWDWLNVPSGYTASTVQGGIFWNNIVIGNYTINAAANRDPWNYAYATSINWVVTSNVAQNTTIINYTWVEVIPNISMTGTYSVTSYGADTSYASGYNTSSGNPVIMSIDHSNPANPVVRYYEINSTIKTFDLSYITSIGVYDERLYAGTDNELFVFNTSQTGKANNLVFIDSMSCGALCFRDNVLDVAAINDTFAITCNTGGILGDNNYLYNYTAGTLGDVALGISPCESVYYNSFMNLLIVNDGITTAHIFNWSNLSDENVIDSGIPSGTSTHDLISHSNQYLFIITAHNEVTKIDISNPANTNIIATCRADRDIQSIESINDNELIIGKTGAISVCDFNNSATYYAAGGYYIAQTIKSFTTNAIIYEINKNSVSKFLAATSEGIKIFLYGKMNQTIIVNQPPTINNIGATDVSPCVGQLVKFTINAADLEGDDIVYDFYCKNSPPIMMKEGFENEFGCTYTINDLGTLTITAWAKDYIGSSITTKYQANIQVQNCTSNNTIFITAIDEGTGGTIEGAFVTLVNDGQTTTTDSSGLAYFETTSGRPYSVTATHPDYYDYSRSGINFEGFPIYMAKKGGAGATTLVISVTDSEGNLMEGVTASATDISTGQNKYSFTGSNGVAIINDMFSSNNLAVSVSSTNYPTQSITTSIHIGETKYLDFTMTRSIGGSQFTVSGRDCSDFISGVWLCGNLSVTGIGSSCVTDADCISGRCNTYSKVCNSFNYTMCDTGGKYAGTGRGNTCVIKSSIFGMLSSATGNILTYFLFFMVIIVFIIIYVVLRKNGNNKGG